MKEIIATMVEGQWLVVFKAPPASPITRREMLRLHRVLDLKLRSYHISLRRRVKTETRKG